MRKHTWNTLRLVAALSLAQLSYTAHAVSCADYNGPTEHCIESGNSVFVVDAYAGVQTLTVDGIEHIFLQDFLYDTVQQNGSPISHDILGMDSTYPNYTDQNGNNGYVVTTDNATTLTLEFVQPGKGQNPDGPTIRLEFNLTPGTAGSNTGTIEEIFTIINNGTDDIDVALYAFTDVDLGLNPMDDEGVLIGPSPYSQYKQFDADFQLLASVDIPVDHYEVSFADTVALKFDPNDASYIGDDTSPALSDTIAAGPGDLQMAAQWNRNLAGNGGTFSYAHTLTVSPASVSAVPVPAALPLALTGLGVLGAMGRRRRLAGQA